MAQANPQLLMRASGEGTVLLVNVPAEFLSIAQGTFFCKVLCKIPLQNCEFYRFSPVLVHYGLITDVSTNPFSSEKSFFSQTCGDRYVFQN